MYVKLGIDSSTHHCARRYVWVRVYLHRSVHVLVGRRLTGHRHINKIWIYTSARTQRRAQRRFEQLVSHLLQPFIQTVIEFGFYIKITLNLYIALCCNQFPLRLLTPL